MTVHIIGCKKERNFKKNGSQLYHLNSCISQTETSYCAYVWVLYQFNGRSGNIRRIFVFRGNVNCFQSPVTPLTLFPDRTQHILGISLDQFPLCNSNILPSYIFSLHIFVTGKTSDGFHMARNSLTTKTHSTNTFTHLKCITISLLIFFSFQPS